MNAQERFFGLLSGTAVADSIGLPREGLTPRRAQRLLGAAPLRHSLIVFPGLRIGLCSDDTEHAWLTAQALVSLSAMNENEFSAGLAKRLKRWLLSLPAGCGMATLKACLRLCVGVAPDKSGVRSAGNGAVMRAPVIGAFFADDWDMLARMTKCSTAITHRDERAQEGALVVALAAAMAYTANGLPVTATSFFERVLPYVQGAELKGRLLQAKAYVQAQRSLSDFVQYLGLQKKGITGYVNHTVPAVIFTWLRYGDDYEQAVTRIVEAGGDTDSNAALVGALIGVNQGAQCIPSPWLQGMKEWPANAAFLQRMAQALATRQASASSRVTVPELPWLLLWLRNLVFLVVVLVHGFRRLLPF